MIALDFDGTVANYGGGPFQLNRPLIRSIWQAQPLMLPDCAICTNQGGLVWGVLNRRRYGDPGKFPTPESFVRRIDLAQQKMPLHGLRLDELRLCVYHPKAPESLIKTTAQQVRDLLRGAPFAWTVHETPAARKPAALMLRAVRATIYYGDSDEDEAAARNAGIPFMRVARF